MQHFGRVDNDDDDNTKNRLMKSEKKSSFAFRCSGEMHVKKCRAEKIISLSITTEQLKRTRSENEISRGLFWIGNSSCDLHRIASSLRRVRIHRSYANSRHHLGRRDGSCAAARSLWFLTSWPIRRALRRPRRAEHWRESDRGSAVPRRAPVRLCPWLHCSPPS